MLGGIFGQKIGMTQFFGDSRKVTPVSVIKLGKWFVTQIKTEAKDGYVAVQIGMPRLRYQDLPFDAEWLKAKKQYFLYIKEVSLFDGVIPEDIVLGRPVGLNDFPATLGKGVSIRGTNKGLGFQGVMRRWNFAGGPKTHGSTFHRKPGSVGNLVFNGKIFKGKKLPGRMGGKGKTVRNVTLLKVDAEQGYLFVKGSIPGKKNSLVMVRR